MSGLWPEDSNSDLNCIFFATCRCQSRSGAGNHAERGPASVCCDSHVPTVGPLGLAGEFTLHCVKGRRSDEMQNSRLGILIIILSRPPIERAESVATGEGCRYTPSRKRHSLRLPN